jgi:VanZ family protein
VRKRYWPLIAAICWLLLITILLIIPGSELPKRNWFNQIYLDKWIHIFLFLVLVLLWAIGLGKNYPTFTRDIKRLFTISLLAIAYGILMEIVQKYFVSNRSFEVKDILADTAGSLLGFWVAKRSVKK